MRSNPALLLALGAALALLPGCTQRVVDPGAPVVSPPPQLVENPEFRSTMDLLHAIEQDRFARRAGLEEELAALREPPPPVDIEFVSGTAVPADQQDELRQLAEQLAADDQLVVGLVGCSDPSGSAALNQRISASRAESVAARLRELGVADAQIGEVIGRGEECEEQERKVKATPSFRDPQEGGAATS